MDNDKCKCGGKLADIHEHDQVIERYCLECGWSSVAGDKWED